MGGYGNPRRLRTPTHGPRFFCILRTSYNILIRFFFFFSPTTTFFETRGWCWRSQSLALSAVLLQDPVWSLSLPLLPSFSLSSLCCLATPSFSSSPSGAQPTTMETRAPGVEHAWRIYGEFKFRRTLSIGGDLEVGRLLSVPFI